MKSDISFYFILYLVAVVTVFAITVERDKTLEQRNEIIAQLIEVYVRPLKVSAYVDTTRYYIDVSRPATVDSVRMKIRTEGPILRNDIAFGVIESSRMIGGRFEKIAETGHVYNDHGDGVLVYPPLAEGTYLFRVAGHKNRIQAHGDMMSVMIGDTSYDIPYAKRFERVDRDTADLYVNVVKSGLEKQQITLSVTDQSDHWVLGLPFKKKVFVGGIETMQGLRVTATPSGKIERTPDESSFTFSWDATNAGKHTFTVTADANRGAGGKDRANVSFMVDVRAPAFLNPPRAKGFWGIPFTFDGQVAGLNPLDLTVDFSHDGQSLGTQPVVPAITVTPGRGWNTLQYSVRYHGISIKEHKATLAAPPPPQVRWTQQNLDKSRNAFIIQFSCADAAGGPVTASLQSQPSGIATLDHIKGTAFTVTINLASKPVSVFLKLLATDQYGGQAASSKQFNIPN